MKVALKICFVIALASTFLIGIGTITAEKAEAKGYSYCPSLSGFPDLNDTYAGQCDHPCGGICGLWIDDVTGDEFYDVRCPLE